MIRTPQSLISELRNSKTLYVYGAGKCAEMVCKILRQADVAIDAVIVQNQAGNPDKVCGVSVYELSDSTLNREDCTIFVAVTNAGLYKGITDSLLLNGYGNFVFPAPNFYLELCTNQIYEFFTNIDEQYQIIDSYRNIEIAHYLLKVNTDENERIVQFRIPIKSGAPYLPKLSLLFENNNFLATFEKQYGRYQFLPYKEGQGKHVQVDKSKIAMYMSRCHADAVLYETIEADWLIPIQGGAALTDIDVCEIKDNTGDNRSRCNKNYSEGSSLYWIWKNTKGQDYVGLCHHKRRLAVSKESFTYIKNQNVDVVTTLPVFAAETIKPFFTGPFLMKNDWKVFMEAISQVSQELYQTALEYENSRFYIPCNVFLMKREHFDEFCQLTFSVVDIIEDFYLEKGVERADRYIGYLIENLLSIYLMHNHERLNIVYTDMEYLL